ncbi:hypothetical protein DLM75_22205 [Leptospira stimsonii]|uniref:Uncharacterized protein n=1 Tax=Leptospira stimsonii TaxID=2202203 RepID=A0A396YV39_9LEPT|nr:hypothetical protein DLM75_22205 [Leptospira stimsonii]
MRISKFNIKEAPAQLEKTLKPLNDSDTFFFREEDGEILYMDRRDAIKFLEAKRKSKNHTFNDAA